MCDTSDFRGHDELLREEALSTVDAENALVGTVQDDNYLARPHHVEIDGNYAYLPGKGGTFGVVDVSEPGTSEIVGGVRGLTNAETIEIEPEAPNVYLAEGESVHAVDLSEPEAPTSSVRPATNRWTASMAGPATRTHCSRRRNRAGWPS